MVKNYNSAISAFSRAIELKPDYALAYFSRANIKYELEEYKYIEEVYSRKVTISWGKIDPQIITQIPESPDFRKVINDLNKTIKLQPDWGFACFNRANIRILQKDYEGAIEDYDQAIKLEPELAEAYFNRGLTLIYMSKADKACNDLGKAGELGVQGAYKAIKRYCYK
jgi:tetratricopeptide (TPR) repeat protein